MHPMDYMDCSKRERFSSRNRVWLNDSNMVVSVTIGNPEVRTRDHMACYVSFETPSPQNVAHWRLWHYRLRWCSQRAREVKRKLRVQCYFQVPRKYWKDSGKALRGLWLVIQFNKVECLSYLQQDRWSRSCFMWKRVGTVTTKMKPSRLLLKMCSLSGEWPASRPCCHPTASKKLYSLFTEWQNLQKNAKLSGLHDKRRLFVDNLGQLWDIGAPDALKEIRSS